MARTTTIHADGSSPLSRYVDLLIAAPEYLERAMKRDAEAQRLLTAPALPEAIKRADGRYWDRQEEIRSGRIIPSPRIWTRRDEKWFKWSRGLLVGSQPRRLRTTRFLERFNAHHFQRFRLAADEARQDGTAKVLTEKLEQAGKVFRRLIKAAQSISQGDDWRTDFTESQIELWSITDELLQWTKPPRERSPARTDNEPADESARSSPTGFLGGAVLADALEVHPTRRDAFFRALHRVRQNLSDDQWHEVSEPRPNSPRFLYRADSPKLQDLAAGYKTPKPA